jgi:hypothetical protein
MTRSFKAVIITLIIAVSSTLIFNTVSAEENDGSIKNYSLVEMTEEDMCKSIDTLINAIVTRDTQVLGSCAMYLTNDTYYELRDFMEKYSASGVLANYVLDYIKPDNSTDGDYVVMANVVTNYNGDEYYTLYELHINSLGQIYGFNVWVY